MIVEITYKCQKIPINRDQVKTEDASKEVQNKAGESVYGGATVYDVGKTPMNYNTPSYYP